MKTHTVAALTACVGALALCAPPAAAAPQPEPSASVRGAHFSPNTPSVDVYLTSFAGGTTKLALSNVGYGDVSNYQSIQPGLYTVGMRPAGADPSTPVAISWTLDAKAGQAFTACAIGMNDALQGRVLTDDLSTAPPDKARVRVIQAASRAPKADITAVNGPVIGTAVPFGSTTDYTDVAAGNWSVTAQSDGDAALSTSGNVTAASGTLTTIVLLDSPQNGIQLRTLRDGLPTGPARQSPAPSGPVNAGSGSAAHEEAARELQTPAFVLTGLALTAMLVLLANTLHRSRSRS